MINLLDKILKESGISLTEDQMEKLITYYEFLVSYNEKVNLTAITEPKDVFLKHFVDSLLLLEHVDIKENAKIIDIGSGAGFPGMVLKIARPDINLTILDALDKRLEFLRQLSDKLGFEVTLIHKRAEDIDESERESFDYATARAVARLNTLLEWCVPYINVKGSLLALKSQSTDDEIKEAENALEILDCQVVDNIKYKLINGDVRNIICIEKESETDRKYPRSVNKIKKNPL